MKSFKTKYIKEKKKNIIFFKVTHPYFEECMMIAKYVKLNCSECILLVVTLFIHKRQYAAGGRSNSSMTSMPGVFYC